MPASFPVARRVPVERTHHGDTFVDDYEWLRDKESPETTAHLEAENAYTQERTAHLEGLRQRIFDEIKARTKETGTRSVPARIGSYWYYSRSIEGKQYGVSCRRFRPGAGRPDAALLDADTEVPGEQVLLDVNELVEAAGLLPHSAPPRSASTATCSPTAPTRSATSGSCCVKDLRTGELLADEVLNTLGPAVTSAAPSCSA